MSASNVRDTGHSAVVLDYRSPRPPALPRAQSGWGIASCIVFVILVLIELGALLALDLDPEVRRGAEWAGLGETLLMIFAPIVFVPLGFLLALIGLLTRGTKSEAAGAGLVLHLVAAACVLAWRFSR